MCLSLCAVNVHAQIAPNNSAPLGDTSKPYSPTFEDAVFAYQAGDISRALKIAEQFATAGNAEAQTMAGHIHLRGETGLVDTDAAVKWYRMAAEQKDPDAYMALGEMSLRSQAGLSASDAMAWFSKASQAGRVDAKRAIGEMYLKGQGIAPNREKGLSWLQQAMDLGDAYAARKMADAYFDRDPNRALELYEVAASYGDNEAAYFAAIMLAENLEVKPDSVKLADLLLQAAESGHAAAQADYGLLVYQGAGVEKSATEAAKWFEKSAKGGDSEGQFLYAYTLAKGEGVEKSFEDAYYWLLKSGDSKVDAYQKDRAALRERLEDNVDPKILKRAKERLEG